MLNQIAYQTYILFFCFLIFRKLFSNNRIKQVKRWKSKLIIIHPNPKVKALRKNYQLCLRKLFTFKNPYNMICILIYGSSSTRLLFKTKQRTGKKVAFPFFSFSVWQLSVLWPSETKKRNQPVKIQYQNMVFSKVWFGSQDLWDLESCLWYSRHHFRFVCRIWFLQKVTSRNLMRYQLYFFFSKKL